MRTIPVDVQQLGPLQFIAVTAKHRDGVQTTTQEGTPLWKVQILLTAPGDDKASLEEISVPAHQEPQITPMTPVMFQDLRARAWSMNTASGQRSGVSFSAAAVAPVRTNGGEK
ncbi:hypothetical protein [Kocuria turfanensis]|uniref:Regulatory protein n=1 Tax=Kocuria turfanensis TaxID=388357 RepID=A0A512IIN1_9MICC|nr:hypothetical protein [Kocuria turfanensis]GEO97579.1 hypothetical protein KTU01_37020 [Kocuria turfanensis]